MIKLVSDSSTLFNQKEAAERGFTTVPLNVTVDGKTYRDYEDITLNEFIQFCKEKKTVSSSQPSIGEKIDTYNELLKNPDDIVLDITIADGLSGTYQTALMAKQACDDPDRVYVVNSKTLCGPQRSLVLKAKDLIDSGKEISEIIDFLNNSRETDVSMVTPIDFDFLARGGRLGKGAAKAGDFLKLIPIAVKTEDGKALKISGFGRTFKKIFSLVEKEFNKAGVDSSYNIWITHADNESVAKKAKEYFEEKYPGANVQIEELCPMFGVHGGPGCLAFQAIKV